MASREPHPSRADDGLNDWIARASSDVAEPATKDYVVLDRGRLTELLETGSADLALVLQIVERFGKRTTDATSEMRPAVAAADAVAVGQVAHSLRGGAGNVGLVRLSRLCEDLELNAAAGVLPTASDLVALESAASVGVAALESLAQELVRATPSSTFS